MTNTRCGPHNGGTGPALAGRGGGTRVSDHRRCAKGAFVQQPWDFVRESRLPGGFPHKEAPDARAPNSAGPRTARNADRRPHPIAAMFLRTLPWSACPVPVPTGERLAIPPAQAAPHADTALIERCIAGDERAWADLVDRYGRLVYSIARRQRLPDDACDDVFQTVFAILLRHLPNLRDHATLAKWLITTTTRECWRYARRGRSKATPDSLPSVPADLPQDELLAWERRQRVQEALSELGGQCEKLLRALFFTTQTPSYATIAQNLGIAVGSIGPIRGRCLKSLLELLPDFGP
jgi:RNA polymerase sigma factor (sigma-70 family)